jgi:hypothetical protein
LNGIVVLSKEFLVHKIYKNYAIIDAKARMRYAGKKKEPEFQLTPPRATDCWLNKKEIREG